jgi:cell division protein FtsB
MSYEKTKLEDMWDEIWADLESQFKQGEEKPKAHIDSFFNYLKEHSVSNSSDQKWCQEIFELLYNKCLDTYHLKNEVDKFKSEQNSHISNSSWKNLFGRNKELEHRLKNSEQTLASCKQENQKLLADISNLKHELNSLEAKIESDKNKAEARISKLLSQVAEQNRNPLTTSVAGSKPRHHMLYGDFKVLIDQHFQSLADKIFRLKFNVSPPKGEERKKEISILKNKLTQKLLVEFYHRLSTSEGSSNSHQEACFKELFDFVKSYLESSPSSEMENALKDLSRNSFELVSKICDAETPAKIWSDSEGTTFDKTKHEALPWCEDSGNICVDLTVSPGYSSVDPETGEERVLVKAVVSTIPIVQDESNQDQNLTKQQPPLDPSEETSTSDGQDSSNDNLSDSATDDAQPQVEAQTQGASQTETESKSSTDETNTPQSEETQ